MFATSAIFIIEFRNPLLFNKEYQPYSAHDKDWEDDEKNHQIEDIFVRDIVGSHIADVCDHINVS